MRRFIVLIFLVFALSEIFGQRPSLTLTFSAVNNTDWVQLDSIKVMNRTQGGDTVLYYPDTVLVLDYQVGIPEPPETADGFQVFQNYPNPVAEQTTINLYVPSKDNVSITVTNILGQVIIRWERELDDGLHSFKFTPGNGSLYSITSRWMGKSSCIKILCAGTSTYKVGSFEYLGSEVSVPQLKAAIDIQSLPFSIGDELLYIGYTDTLQSGVLDSPEDYKSYTFQFATNIPCSGIPTVDYEGQVYNTIQIFSQCWLKENLNVGEMIPGTEVQTNNGILEKYCYNNESDSCSKFGALYRWDEMMQYVTQPGVQGICPPGWHIPSDDEWKVLEGAVDSLYVIGEITWNESGYVGVDVGTNLKTTSGWNWNGNGTDLFGFTGQPAGHRTLNGGFVLIGTCSYWWASTEVNLSSKMGHSVSSYHEEIYHESFNKEVGFSVRCLKDD
jgi:uncharacterized protein (TIGR02145 family)